MHLVIGQKIYGFWEGMEANNTQRMQEVWSSNL